LSLLGDLSIFLDASFFIHVGSISPRYQPYHIWTWFNDQAYNIDWECTVADSIGLVSKWPRPPIDYDVDRESTSAEGVRKFFWSSAPYQKTIAFSLVLGWGFLKVSSHFSACIEIHNHHSGTGADQHRWNRSTQRGYFLSIGSSKILQL
jgi:hypothetical protein